MSRGRPLAYALRGQNYGSIIREVHDVVWNEIHREIWHELRKPEARP